jgi:hypothetical protein
MRGGHRERDNGFLSFKWERKRWLLRVRRAADGASSISFLFQRRKDGLHSSGPRRASEASITSILSWGQAPKTPPSLRSNKDGRLIVG